jgi:hypothetical protein
MMITEPEAVTRRGDGEAPEAGIGRAAVIGAILGYLVVFPLVSVILLVAGAGLVSAVAVGAYVAIWGGPGFGAMFGASYYVSKFTDKPSPSPSGAVAQSAAVAPASSPPRTQLVTVGIRRPL